MQRHGWMRWPLLLGLLLAGCDSGMEPDDEPGSVEITPGSGTLEALQDTLRLEATVRDARGGVVANARVEWTALDPEIATVDSLGRVVARGEGTARVTAESGDLADTAQVAVLASAPAAALNFVEFAAAAPPLVEYDTSFWAVRGENRELEIHFQGDEPGEEGERFLEFRVPGDALLRYPDGRAFAEGDSVRIRVQISPSGRFLFQFEPSGLRFDPERPAELRIHYGAARLEGGISEDDLFVWKQESADNPWLRILTLRIKDGDEVRAEITGFTWFGLATS